MILKYEQVKKIHKVDEYYRSNRYNTLGKL